jgi:hypothetical protein
MPDWLAPLWPAIEVLGLTLGLIAAVGLLIFAVAFVITRLSALSARSREYPPAPLWFHFAVMLAMWAGIWLGLRWPGPRWFAWTAVVGLGLYFVGLTLSYRWGVLRPKARWLRFGPVVVWFAMALPDAMFGRLTAPGMLALVVLVGWLMPRNG